MDRVPVILQVLPALGVGGVEQGTIDTAEAVVKAGGRAIVVSDTGALLPRLRYVGGTHYLLPLLKSASPFVFRKKVRLLQHILRHEKVDLVHARSRFPAWVAAAACWKEKIPLVTTWHGVHPARLCFKRYYNAGLLKGARIIAVSQYIAKRLKKEYRIKEERLVTIPRGCDPGYFKADGVSGARVQPLVDQWNIPEDSPVILMPGRVTRWKGQAWLVEALGRLAAQEPELSWVCILVGPETDPSFARYVYRRACRLGIAERLRFVGPCDDMAAAYTLATMVIVPSLRPEPFGRVAIEAQMMGRPVIGTAHGGLLESIISDKTGILVPPHDRDALMKAVKTLLVADDDIKMAMNHDAQEHVLAHYTKQKMQQDTLAVYDDLIGCSLRDHFDKPAEDEEKLREHE